MTRRYREDSERIVKVRGVYVRRPQATPFRVTASDHLKDAAEILLGVVIFTALFLGIPFLLFLIAAPQ
jgi:hypothetical protein